MVNASREILHSEVKLHSGTGHSNITFYHLDNGYAQIVWMVKSYVWMSCAWIGGGGGGGGDQGYTNPQIRDLTIQDPN